MSLGLQFTGWFGELKTVIAKKLFLRSSDYVDLNNVTIRTRRGTTQIDHVIISRYGVFVVETKNMSGWIFGGEDDPFWIKTNRGNKLRFQNPLHQNESHIRALSNLARVAPEKMHSVVLFRGNCSLRTQMPPNVLTGGYITYVKSKRQVLFTEAEVKRIVATIKAVMLPKTRATHLTRGSFEATLREHHDLWSVRQPAGPEDGQVRQQCRKSVLGLQPVSVVPVCRKAGQPV